MNNPEATNLNGYYFKDENGRKLLENEINNRQSQYNSIKDQVDSLVTEGFVPYAVDSTSDMVNTKRIYVLKSTGKWYYYDTDTSTWTIGGDYQAVDPASIMSNILDASTEPTVDLTSIVWNKGGVDATTHKPSELNNNRIRNFTILKVKAGSTINFTGYGSSADTGFLFKVSNYKYTPNAYPWFIEEPVAFADNATTYTYPYDCYTVITCVTRDYRNLSEDDMADDFASIKAYFSSSKIYLAEEKPAEKSIFTNLDSQLETENGYYYALSGNVATSGTGTGTNDNKAIKSPIIVDGTGYIRIFQSDGKHSTAGNLDGGSYVQYTFLNKDGAKVTNAFDSLSGTAQGATGAKVPAGAKYCFINVNTNNNALVVRYTPELDNEQSGIRLIGDGGQCKLVAHGGLEYYAPYETIPAYTIAGQKGMWACKLDVRETADGKYVMSHDATIDRMFDGSGNVADMTLAQLLTYTVDAGNHIEDYPNEKIVTLEEALAICKKYGMYVFLDIKEVSDKTSLANVLQIISNYGLLNQTIYQNSGGDRKYDMWLRDLNKEIPIISWTTSMSDAFIYHTSLAYGNATPSLDAWNTEYSTKYDDIQAYGFPVCCAVIDTNDSLARVNEAIEEYGASLIVTDRVCPADISPNVYTA